MSVLTAVFVAMDPKILVLAMLSVASAGDVASRMKRSVLFTPAAGMGIYLAVAFPVDLPQYALSVSLNFEANYNLPSNATELAYGPGVTEVRKARRVTRSKVYSTFEDALERDGLLSKTCLLRTICETSATSILGHNGLVGDLLHVVFTPSTTEDEGISSVYADAERAGRKGRENCVRTYPECPVDLYELISVWST